MSSLLSTEVARFRTWASEYPVERRTGEWECDYENWAPLHQSFLDYLKSHSPEDATAAEISDLLYAVGRDNEIEYLVATLSGESGWFLFLLPYAVQVADPDVRWQFAVQLGLGAFPLVAAEPALLTLVQDEHEYVSRMALQALGRIGSAHAETLCEHAWRTGDEYQRIMALWVLNDIKSVKLSEYLSMAKADGRRFVISNAIEIEQGTPTRDV